MLVGFTRKPEALMRHGLFTLAAGLALVPSAAGQQPEGRRPKARAVLNSPGSEVWCVAFSPDGKTLAAACIHRVALWDVATGRSRKGPPQPVPRYIAAVAFSPDGKVLAWGDADPSVAYRDGRLLRMPGLIRFWEVGTGRVKVACRGHHDVILALAFSPDGKSLASGSADSTARLWDAASAAPRAVLRGHKPVLRSVAFSPDGKTLAAGPAPHVKVWEVVGGQLRGALSAEGFTGVCVAFHPAGRVLAEGGKDVRLHDLATGKVLRVLRGHRGTVFRVAFSPDGKLLASGGGGNGGPGEVKVWEVATGKEVAALAGHTSAVYALAFSPDGRLLASGSADGTVRLWDVPALTRAGR
jgi:WD40 repeat protein